MTYSLINKCAKNYYNRTFIVPVIAKNVVTCFFLRHSVQCFHVTVWLKSWAGFFSGQMLTSSLSELPLLLHIHTFSGEFLQF